MKQGKYWEKAILICSGSILALITIEIVLRNAGFFSGLSTCLPKYRKSNPIYHHSFVPNSKGCLMTREFKISYSINSLGLRDREYSLKKPEGSYRIIMLGDSFVEGHGVQIEETFSKQLESLLNNEVKTKKFEVINAGVASYSPTLEYIFFKNELLALQPDLVVLHFDQSDIVNEYQYQSATLFNAKNEPIAVFPQVFTKESPLLGKKFGLLLKPISRFLFEYSHLYRLANYFLARALSNEPQEKIVFGDIETDAAIGIREKEYPHVEEAWDLVKKRILLLRNLLLENKIDFILSVYPYAIHVSRDENTEGRKNWGFGSDKIYQPKHIEIIEEFGQKEAIIVFNFLKDFRNTSLKPLYYTYDGHFTSKGHKVMAEGYLRRLNDLGVLDKKE